MQSASSIEAEVQDQTNLTYLFFEQIGHLDRRYHADNTYIFQEGWIFGESVLKNLYAQTKFCVVKNPVETESIKPRYLYFKSTFYPVSSIRFIEKNVMDQKQS